MKKGQNVEYNNTDGTNRDADRIGIALSGVKDNGRVNVQPAGSADSVEMEFIADPDAYDAEHDGNRGLCCWDV